MYVIIIGAGRIGVTLARWLLSAEHEVTIIERSSAVCDSLEDELGGIAVPGDGTEVGVLAKAGANRADVLIGATSMDDVNLVSCQLARHRFDVSSTIALVNEPEHRHLFELLGIGGIIDTTELIVSTVQEELSGFMVEQIGERG